MLIKIDPSIQPWSARKSIWVQALQEWLILFLGCLFDRSLWINFKEGRVKP